MAADVTNMNISNAHLRFRRMYGEYNGECIEEGEVLTLNKHVF